MRPFLMPRTGGARKALRDASPPREFLHHRLEADAALAGERGRFGFGALFGVAAGEADADFMAAEHRPLALARRMLLADEFALPSAARGRVGADIGEVPVAAADPAVMQHHDVGVAAVDTVEHPDVDRVESVGDAACAGVVNGGAASSLIGVISDLKGTPG